MKSVFLVCVCVCTLSAGVVPAAASAAERWSPSPQPALSVSGGTVLPSCWTLPLPRLAGASGIGSSGSSRGSIREQHL